MDQVNLLVRLIFKRLIMMAFWGLAQVRRFGIILAEMEFQV